MTTPDNCDHETTCFKAEPNLKDLAALKVNPNLR